MSPHIDNPFDTRPPGNPDTAKFLAALGDQPAAEAYRQAMGEDGGSPTTDAQEPKLTPEELARLQAIQDRDRAQELVHLRKRQYLEWAEEFKLGGADPEAWISDIFTFNPDGTVAVDGDLNLSRKSLTRLPPAFTRVNGMVDLSNNHLTALDGLPKEIHGDLLLSKNQITSLKGLPNEIHGCLYLPRNQITSLEGLPNEIHGYLDLSRNQITSLDELQGKKIDGDLYLRDITAQSIPEGIKLGGRVFVNASQTALKQDAESKGYNVKII